MGIAYFTKESIPVIFGGDLNTGPHTKTYESIDKIFKAELALPRGWVSALAKDGPFYYQEAELVKGATPVWDPKKPGVPGSPATATWTIPTGTPTVGELKNAYV